MAAAPPKPPRDVRELALCRDAIRLGLYDPQSAQFDTERLYAERPDERVYELTVNAKNRFGGYVGRERMFCAVSVETGAVIRLT